MCALCLAKMDQWLDLYVSLAHAYIHRVTRTAGRHICDSVDDRSQCIILPLWLLSWLLARHIDWARGLFDSGRCFRYRQLLLFPVGGIPMDAHARIRASFRNYFSNIVFCKAIWKWLFLVFFFRRTHTHTHIPISLRSFTMQGRYHFRTSQSILNSLCLVPSCVQWMKTANDIT